MSKGGDGDTTFSYTIHVVDELDKPKGFDYAGVQWVELTTEAGTERIWERQSGVDD